MSIANAPETTAVIESEIKPNIDDNAPMTPNNEAEALPAIPAVLPPEASDKPIRVLKEGSCPSLTGRSTLGYELGLDDHSELYLRLISNTGSGFFSKEWVACSVIEQLITGASELTSTSFKALFPHKSVNTGGFVMAVIKALGLIQTNVGNSRWHQHVTEVTFEQIAIEAMVHGEKAQQISVSKPTGRRKHKEVE